MRREPPRWREGDQQVPWRDASGILGPCVGILAIFGLIGVQPGLVEHGYTERFGQWIPLLLSWATGLVPLSLAEWVELGIVVWIAWGVGRALPAVLSGRRRWHNAAANGLARLLPVTAIAMVGFYGLWGLNYARAGAAAWSAA